MNNVITFVDICNTLADIRGELDLMGVDTTVYPSNVSETVWAEGSIFGRANQYENVVNLVKKLAESTNIVYLTARPISSIEATLKWLDKYDLPKAPLIFSGGTPKGQIIYNHVRSRDYTAINVVEDAPNEIQSIRDITDKLSIPVNFYIPDQAYNTEFPGIRLETK